MRKVHLEGVVDLHCHYGPDNFADIPFAVTATLAATEARDMGCAALVLKAHDFPSPALAYSVDQAVDGIAVFGGITLDYKVGGLNVHAVEAALRLGARVVWLPTSSSHQEVLNGNAARRGLPAPGIKIIDEDGAILPVVRDIADLVVESDALLATGHITAAEHFAIARAFGSSGRVVVTHAGEELAGPNLSLSETVALAELGATIELTALTCLPYKHSAGRSIADVAGTIRAVGIGRVILGSDLGFNDQLPHPAQGYMDYVDRLWEEGVEESALRRMCCENPARLLRLAP
jgi:hypothetical protein